MTTKIDQVIQEMKVSLNKIPEISESTENLEHINAVLDFGYLCQSHMPQILEKLERLKHEHEMDYCHMQNLRDHADKLQHQNQILLEAVRKIRKKAKDPLIAAIADDVLDPKILVEQEALKKVREG